MNAEMLSYSRSHGVFAGIDLSGGVLRPDKDANARAYGTVAPKDIATEAKRVVAPAAASAFLQSLGREVAGTAGKP
jgi:lipid-binding SYLF domain-containing protein